MSGIAVACCQARLAFGDPAGNRAALDRLLREAARRGARIVVLPELAASGYRFADRDEAWQLAEPLDGPTVTGWHAVAADEDVIVVGGLCERAGGELHNSAVLVDAGGVRAVYRKAHLWDGESLTFGAGDAAPPVVDTVFGRVAVVICYDLEFPEWIRLPALAGAQLLCAPVNWPSTPRPARERPAEVVRVQADAAVNRMFIAACDRVGAERGTDWIGGSVIVDPDGWPLAGPLSAPAAGCILADCRLEDARDKRTGPRNDVHADRRPGLYRAILETGTATAAS
ncbi:MAG TPA: nitrilase family protein [Solirubrobacteraceae bacterium]|nr:nitrilase family protein [Solirubrobacteraceae bacterium]